MNMGAKMKDAYFTCTETSCFGNRDGKCMILERRCKREPCPFYKTLEKVQAQEVDIYRRKLHVDREEIMGC